MRGSNRRHHSTQNADHAKNSCRDGETADIDLQMNIAGLQIVTKCTHQRQRTDAPRDQIRDADSSNSSGEGDCQRLREKLKEDVVLLRAQRLSTPISRVRCCTEPSIMFISPMPPMPRVRAPMNASKILSAVVTNTETAQNKLFSLVTILSLLDAQFPRHLTQHSKQNFGVVII